MQSCKNSSTNFWNSMNLLGSDAQEGWRVAEINAALTDGAMALQVVQQCNYCQIEIYHFPT
jgi:hypothetical protein